MLVVALVGMVPPAHAASARQVSLLRLAGLRVTAPLPLHGFTAARFPHWRDPDRNGCDAREEEADAEFRHGVWCCVFMTV